MVKPNENQKEFLDEIINDLNEYNKTIKTVATPSPSLPETLIERVDTVVKAKFPNLLQADFAKELAALRSHYIAQDMIDGRVNLLQPADVMTFLKEDKANIFTPKIMTEISDEALENLLKSNSRNYAISLSEAQEYEISARRLLIKGRDDGFYEQIVKNGVMSMRDGKRTEPVAASKAVQHFRKAVAALQQHYQSRTEKLAQPITEAKNDAEASAARVKELFAHASDARGLNDIVTHMALVVQSIPFASSKETEQFTLEIEKYIGEFAKSDGKIEPLKPKTPKLPLLFGRKQAKELAAKQAKTIDIVNESLQSLTPYQLELLSGVNSPIKATKGKDGNPQIKSEYNKICKLHQTADIDHRQNKRDYEQLVASSSGMAEFLTESLQKIDRYMEDAQKAQKDKAQKKTAELTGIAPGEKSGATKVGQRRSIER